MYKQKGISKINIFQIKQYMMLSSLENEVDGIALMTLTEQAIEKLILVICPKQVERSQHKKTTKLTNTLPLNSVEQCSSPDLAAGGAAESMDDNRVQAFSSQSNIQLR